MRRSFRSHRNRRRQSKWQRVLTKQREMQASRSVSWPNSMPFSKRAKPERGCREADRNQAQVCASKAHEGATAKSALDEATEQLEEVMKELPEANTELQFSLVRDCPLQGTS